MFACKGLEVWIYGNCYLWEQNHLNSDHKRFLHFHFLETGVAIPWLHLQQKYGLLTKVPLGHIKRLWSMMQRPSYMFDKISNTPLKTVRKEKTVECTKLPVRYSKC